MTMVEAVFRIRIGVDPHSNRRQDPDPYVDIGTNPDPSRHIEL